MLDFQGAYPVPGIQAALETTENIVWWGLRHQQIVQGGMISGSSLDSGASPTDLLRAGLLLGKKTSDGKLYQWDPTATDGTEIIYGVLLVDQKAKRDGVALDRWIGPILVGGNVKNTAILVAGNANAGINGDNNEMLVRAQMKNRFIFDDDLIGNDFAGLKRVIAKTADYSVLEADNGTLFTNEGASGAVNFTLPSARPGYHFMFAVVADQTVTITATPVDSLVAFNDAAADSIAFSTAAEKVGGIIEVFGLSTTKWLAKVSLGSETQTPTIAT